VRDGLTGLLTHTAFLERVRAALATAHRTPDRPLALGQSSDLDSFKAVNDTYGHPSSDRVLAALGVLLRAARLRASDTIAGWGARSSPLLLAKISAPRRRFRLIERLLAEFATIRHRAWREDLPRRFQRGRRPLRARKDEPRAFARSARTMRFTPPRRPRGGVVRPGEGGGRGSCFENPHLTRHARHAQSWCIHFAVLLLVGASSLHAEGPANLTPTGLFEAVAARSASRRLIRTASGTRRFRRRSKSSAAHHRGALRRSPMRAARRRAPPRRPETRDGTAEVLLWSQMHGDEPTATSALVDRRRVPRADEDERGDGAAPIAADDLPPPMLNPDGADEDDPPERAGDRHQPRRPPPPDAGRAVP